MTARRRTGMIAAALAIAACASTAERTELTTAGPSAEDVFDARSLAVNGRPPSFEEKRQWEGAVEDRVFAYLRQHPAMQQDPHYNEFRFSWQVTVGTTPAEVRLLLGDPNEQTIDPARMAALAEQQWPNVQTTAKEAWVYEPGWVLYFDERAVVNIIHRVSGPPPRGRRYWPAASPA
jgi:hypothetical protein